MCLFVRLQGEASEGMILAAVLTDSSLPNGELVAPIRPPGARPNFLHLEWFRGWCRATLPCRLARPRRASWRSVEDAARQLQVGYEGRIYDVGILCAEGTQPGSRVYLDGCSPSDSPPKILKSGPWADIKEKLRVVAGEGTYDGTRLVTVAGPVTAAAGLSDGAAIS